MRKTFIVPFNRSNSLNSTNNTTKLMSVKDKITLFSTKQNTNLTKIKPTSDEKYEFRISLKKLDEEHPTVRSEKILQVKPRAENQIQVTKPSNKNNRDYVNYFNDIRTGSSSECTNFFQIKKNSV